MDRFGGANVDAAGGMDRNDETGLTGKLAGEKELLLVPTGERAQLGPTTRRLYVVIGDEAVSEGRDCPGREERPAAQRWLCVIARSLSNSIDCSDLDRAFASVTLSSRTHGRRHRGSELVNKSIPWLPALAGSSAI